MTINNNVLNADFNIRSDILVCLFLVISTMTVYWQVRHFSFINFDDHLYVVNNKHIFQKGLTRDNIIWAFTDGTKVTNYFAPVTLLSFIFDYKRYGMNAGGYHMTNLFFHIVNTLLLFFVLRRMTGHIWRSGFVAALFALHPLHVESVAWVTERKDVLCAFFWMLTMWAYVWYAECPGVKRYLVVLLFFILGLMSKPMIVTLPFVLILLDYWPLQRIQKVKGLRLKAQNTYKNSGIRNSESETRILQHGTLSHLVCEKIPMFILAAILSIVTFIVHQKGGTVASLYELSLKVRFENALVSYFNYIEKTLWPNSLAALYPYEVIFPWWQILSALILLICISLLSIIFVRNYPWFIVGWLWYLGTLVPIIGLVHVGRQAMADRYTYVPLIGIFIIFTWIMALLAARSRFNKIVVTTIATSLLFILMALTWCQIRYWSDSITFFRHIINVTDGNAVAHKNLGSALLEEGRTTEAISHFRTALRLYPGYDSAYNYLGLSMQKLGHMDEAANYFYVALSINPESKITHNHVGNILAIQGKLDKAIEHYNAALRICPDYADVHNNLGLVLVRKGYIEKALFHFQKALKIKHRFDAAHRNYNRTKVMQNKIYAAANNMQEALELINDDKGLYDRLKYLEKREKEIDAVINIYQKSLSVQPGYNPEALDIKNLPQIYEAIVKYNEVISLLEKANSGVFDSQEER